MGERGELDERGRRIVEVAMDLAERDGFEAVRLRDVSREAGVALATIYRRFASKTDILAAALELESRRLEAILGERSPPAGGLEARLTWFFGVVTDLMVARPKLTRAMLRAVAADDPELSTKVLRYHDRMARLVGQAAFDGAAEAPSQDTTAALMVLQQAWFASLVGWAGGLHDPDTIKRETATAARLVVAGLRALRGGEDAP